VSGLLCLSSAVHGENINLPVCVCLRVCVSVTLSVNAPTGHTRLMHSFLLSGDDLPQCGTCQCPLTVKHILVECVDLKDVRNKHFVASSIKYLFDNIEAYKNH